MTISMHWKAECEADEIKIRPSKSEALVLCWKMVGCLLVREEAGDGQVIRDGICGNAGAVPGHFKAFNLLVCSCPDPHLLS